MLPGSPATDQRSSHRPAGKRHGLVESARDQSRQTGMGAQGRADDVCAAGVQPFLKQAVSEQVGGDRDASIIASGPIHSFLQARLTRCHKTQVHRHSEQRRQQCGGGAQVGLRSSVRRSRRRQNDRIIATPAGFHQLFGHYLHDCAAGSQGRGDGDVGCPLAATWVGRSVRTWYPRDKNAGTTIAGPQRLRSPDSTSLGVGPNTSTNATWTRAAEQRAHPRREVADHLDTTRLCGCRARRAADSSDTCRNTDREPVAAFDHRRDDVLVVQAPFAAAARPCRQRAGHCCCRAARAAARDARRRRRDVAPAHAISPCRTVTAT